MTISSKLRDYAVHFEPEPSFLEGLLRGPRRLVVVDENVWRLHGGGLLAGIPESDLLVMRATEDTKTLEGVQAIYDGLMSRGAKKNTRLVSIGGGIVQDVTGFAASTLYRGLPWTFVPTTLLAQADSCIGSKTSLNYKRFKNVLGTFYPPTDVHIHAPFLATLSDDDFRSGLGEVVKLHVMGGADDAAALRAALPALLAHEPEPLSEAIRRSLAIKLDYMAGDEFDTGRRNLLNYGHCFGHALETVSGYAVPHGQAVVVGMVLANLAAVRRGLLRREASMALAQSLLVPSLSVRIRAAHLEPEALLAAMRHDKKRVGDGLVMVMLRDDHALLKAEDYAERELREVLPELRDVLGERVGA